MSQVNDITYIEEIGILQLYLGTAQLGRDLQRGICLLYTSDAADD